MKGRAATVGVIAGIATAAVAAAFASTVRCIDTAVFYYPPALIWASLGVAAIAGGASVASAPAGRRVAIAMMVIGILVLAVALVGPPYRSCAQFGLFR